ncbi:MAG: diguanylate cyclase, partial [Deltaproteobacteria bacterium]|nr:diguanylate cyclase [Deltaproteobacteria bacterium]
LDQLEHPMVDEFVKSLEGFQDELTGLHSKKSFDGLYEKSVKQKESHETISVMVFILEGFDELNDKLGNRRTLEIVQALGETVNKHFGQVGISTRIGSDQIATILPNTDPRIAEQMLDDFSKNVQDQGLAGIQADIQPETHSEGFSFSISAGLAKGQGSEKIEVLSNLARSSKKTVARFLG